MSDDVIQEAYTRWIGSPYPRGTQPKDMKPATLHDAFFAGWRSCTAERDAWKESARHFWENSEYWRKRVEKTVAERDALATEYREYQSKAIQTWCEIQQVLGKALGLPAYQDGADLSITIADSPIELAQQTAERLGAFAADLAEAKRRMEWWRNRWEKECAQNQALAAEYRQLQAVHSEVVQRRDQEAMDAVRFAAQMQRLREALALIGQRLKGEQGPHNLTSNYRYHAVLIADEYNALYPVLREACDARAALSEPAGGATLPCPTCGGSGRVVDGGRGEPLLVGFDDVATGAEQHPPCICGHPEREHMGKPVGGECGWDTCPCVEYRATPPGTGEAGKE